MTSPSTKSLASALAENTAWLRRLARALVGDSGADDLVQDTLEVALKRPPATDRPIRPWLRTVARNVVRMQRRSSTRREGREQQVLTLEESEGPSASLAKLETQTRIVQAVTALDEPYRQTLVMRYVDDLSPAEIARRLDVPAGTIRSRLKRGLDMLRADFARQEDLPHWKLALAPFAMPTKAAAAVPHTVIGGVVMKAGLALLAAVATVVVIATVTHSRETRSSSAGNDPAASDARPTLAAPAPDDTPASAAGTERGKVRRFVSADERARFASALVAARKGQAEQPLKTYDYSGTRIETGMNYPIRRALPGQLDKNYIRSSIAEVLPLMKECYELALATDPTLAGNLTVDFVIDAEEDVGGYVREAAVAEDSELLHPALAECVTQTILSVEFVAPEGGGAVRVQYPFLFATTPD